MCKGVLAAMLTLACLGSSADAAPRRRKKNPPPPPPEIHFEYRIDTFGYLQTRQVASSSINPDNLILKLPYLSGILDLRPEFRASAIDDKLRATVRPRLIAEHLATDTGAGPNNRRESKTEVAADLTDAYVEMRFTDSLRSTAGLEVYQWGPSELYNASNPFFHLRTAGRSAFFKEKGEVFVRLGVDWTTNLNTMAIINPISNNEKGWRSGDEEFKASGMLKSELSAENPANYLGVAGGVQPDGRPFFGEYFNYGWESGVSVYIDARHPVGRRRFTPVEDQLFNVEISKQEDDRTIETLSIAGLRWEGRIDFRIEYLYNSQGFTRDEFDLALASLRSLSIYLPRNYQRILQPGLELFGQHVLYFSARLSDIGPSSDASVFLRSVYSLQDGSNTLQIAGEKPLSDSVVLNLEGNFAFGEDDSEFTLADRYQAIVGFKWTL